VTLQRLPRAPYPRRASVQAFGRTDPSAEVIHAKRLGRMANLTFDMVREAASNPTPIRW
jgi:hypothetical protein